MSSSSLSSSTSSYSSPSSSSSFSNLSLNDAFNVSFIHTSGIDNNLNAFIRSKEKTLSLEYYPDAMDDTFGIESTWSHVEKICSNVYLVSSVSDDQSQLSDSLTRTNTTY
jgi:hypothetical protein